MRVYNCSDLKLHSSKKANNETVSNCHCQKFVASAYAESFLELTTFHISELLCRKLPQPFVMKIHVISSLLLTMRDNYDGR